ncbi:O-acyltransferase like protein-like [Glandiceps talaboti]
MSLLVTSLLLSLFGSSCYCARIDDGFDGLGQIHHHLTEVLRFDRIWHQMTTVYQSSPVNVDVLHILDSVGATLNVNVTKDCPVNSNTANTNEDYVDDIISKLTNVSEVCLIASLQVMVDYNCSPQERYAVQIYDAIGKLESNVLRGDLRWFGSFAECRDVTDVPVTISTSSPPSSFNAKYCVATCRYPRSSSTDIPLQLGVCVPDTCTQDELLTVVSLGLENRRLGILFDKLEVLDVYCEYDDPLSVGAIVVLAVLGFVVTLVVTVTLWDYYQRPKKSIHDVTSEDEPSAKERSERDDTNREVKQSDRNRPRINLDSGDASDDIYDVIEDCEQDQTPKSSHDDKSESHPQDMGGPKSHPMRAFSMITSGSSLLSTTYNTKTETLSAVYGMKFLTMMWVFYAMNYEVSITLVMNPVDLGGASIIAQPVADAGLATDTYLLISGMLLSYHTLLGLSRQRRVNWFVLLLNKLWRFCPGYYFVLFLYMYCLVYVCQGPMQFMVEKIIEPCYEYWWTNLLFIQNLFPYLDPIRQRCMGWSWHICLLMQYFIITPFIVMALHWKKKLGFIIIGLLFAMDFISTGLLSWYYGLPAVGGLPYYNDNADDAPVADYIYSKPHTRIASYLVGVCLGYVLVHHKPGKDMHWFFQGLCWIASIISGFTMVYCKYWASVGQPWTQAMTVTFLTFSRFVFSLAVAWCLFACSTGIGGPVNKFLSWRFFIPMSRLTYCVYLIHPLVMIKFWTGAQSQMYVSDLNYGTVSNAFAKPRYTVSVGVLVSEAWLEYDTDEEPVKRYALYVIAQGMRAGFQYQLRSTMIENI